MEPLTTLAELVAAGAHRSLEVAAGKAGFDISVAADLLSRRYGNRLQPLPGVLESLVNEVQYATHAAARINLGQNVAASAFGRLPGFESGYSYTVIGKINDPLRPKGEGRQVSFPIRINSNRELSFAELQQAIDEALAELELSGEGRITVTINSPPGIRNAIADVEREITGDTPKPVIEVLSVYRGA